jgi:predicted HicB family RNase H-like nuclease
MARSTGQKRPKPGEGIVGVRMPNEVIVDLKAEARRQNISLGKLIQELWARYRSMQQETQNQ